MFFIDGHYEYSFIILLFYIFILFGHPAAFDSVGRKKDNRFLRE